MNARTVGGLRPLRAASLLLLLSSGQGLAVTRLVPVATGLQAPLLVTAPPGDSDRIFVLEQAGRVRIVKNGVLLPVPFLDVSASISCCGERGLLGLAFHPLYRWTGRFFVYVTDASGNTEVSEYRVSSDPDLANAGSKRVVLTQTQPFSNHNGGNLVFGPNDGFLYVGLGDGGSGGDPSNNGQNLQTFLGKILRIDVDGRDAGKGYSAPWGNPFNWGVGTPFPGATPLPEIWAWGLRNAWRFSFDRASGDLWIGDVGQDLWEEVDFQPASSFGGEDYGWRLMEGTHCYNPSTDCAATGLTLPVLEYGHGGNPSRCSVTGGFVYRGALAPDAVGRYVFGDYCTGEILSALEAGGKALDQRNDTASWRPAGGGHVTNLSSFGEDAAGELYVCDIGAGVVYRLQDGAPASERLVPIVLDAPGLFGTRYSTELLLTNAGTVPAAVHADYVPARSLGATGGGAVDFSLGAGEVRQIPDAVAFLRQSLPIPSAVSAQGGTLRLSFQGASTPSAVSAVARTTTPSGAGRAGLAARSPRPGELFGDAAVVFGLRESASDRSNLAFLNAGTSGPVSLRVTLRSAGGTGSYVWPETIVLGPGEWRQLDRPLAAAGYGSAWARVERIAGTDPFWTYAVVNDNTTGDGSLVEPIQQVRPAEAQLVPAVVETPAFETELVLLNPTSFAGVAELTYVESLASGGSRFTMTETLAAGEQKILPSFLDRMRQSVAGFPGKGGNLSGSLTVRFLMNRGIGGPSVVGLVGGAAAARVSSQASGGGAFGVFYRGLGLSETAWDEAWVHGLRQTSEARTNLAVVHAGTGNDGPLTLRIDLFDGRVAGRQVGSSSLVLPPGGWAQIDQVLGATVAETGWARITRTSGSARFLAYGVVNDGARPGMGTGDGSYLAMEAETGSGLVIVGSRNPR